MDENINITDIKINKKGFALNHAFCNQINLVHGHKHIFINNFYID